MKTKFQCPGCGHKIKVSAAVMGKKGKCPACQSLVRVPTLQQFQAAVASRAPAVSEKKPTEPGNSPLWDDEEFDKLLGDNDPFSEAVAESAGTPANSKPVPKIKRKTKTKASKSQRPKTWRAFGGMVMGIFLMLATVPVSFACFFVAGQMMDSRDWPTVEGRIIHSEVRRVGFGKKQRYRAEVRYTFDVDGRSYQGSRIRLGDTTGNSESAQRSLIADYQLGANVAVYYDPDSPQQSVLETGGWPWTMAIGPLILGGLGWVFFAVSTGRMQA